MTVRANETDVVYVKTDDPDNPVVQVDPGKPIPDNALGGHVDQLVAAGVLVSDDEDTRPSGVHAILREVGDDPVRAAAELEVEQAASRPRKTLVEGLEKVIAEADPPGAQA